MSGCRIEDVRPTAGEPTMAVIVLMYHRTPKGSPEGFYDVAMTTFREQITRMSDAGVSFVRFSECDHEDYVERGTHVAVTFDDGHASNAEAFAFLADRRIVPTSFIVRDWSERDPTFLSKRAIVDLRKVCEFGAHGASHIDLRTTTDPQLTSELSSSRDFLAEILHEPIATMALPGGKGDARVMRFAVREGYALVGNSRPLPHARRGLGVNRICVHSRSGVDEPRRWANAGAPYWLLRRARLAVSEKGPRILGDRVYAEATKLLK
jgi:peptidoglycan/xylan/chitin deacetylase (PgdA/CDA1 family)